MMSIMIAPSVLACDFGVLADEVKKAEAAGADLIHIDVMDGHFVPNITIGPCIVEAISLRTKLPIESHLMIDNPWLYLNEFINAGSSIVTLHIEPYLCRPTRSTYRLEVSRIKKDIKAIKAKGAKAAVALNPKTSYRYIEGLLNELSMILVMSVNPGFAGQKFIPEVLPKIAALRKIYDGDIAVDGGINDETAGAVVKAGANILVAGSYFYNSKNPLEAVKKLKHLHT